MEAIKSFLSQLNWNMSASTICEISLLALVVFLLLRKPVGTQSARLIRGVLVIAILLFFAYLAKLHLVIFFVRPFVPLTALILIVIFQPEIRRGLSYIGSMKLFSFESADKHDLDELASDINQIILAVKELAEHKFGALLVIEAPEAHHLYLSPGTPVNADISANLILSMCFPKTPLHDGAIIIQHGKIKSAGVILPITDKRILSHVYGTRHRAALGLSEVFDCLCILVSEETGSICTTYQGNLQHYDQAEELTDCLKQFYNRQQRQKLKSTMLTENSIKMSSPEVDA